MENHKDHGAVVALATKLRDQGKNDIEIRQAIRAQFKTYVKAAINAGKDFLPITVENVAVHNTIEANAGGITVDRPVFKGMKSATYRFIPPITGEKIVPASGEVQQNDANSGYRVRPINDPLQGGYCAAINVAWEAETPLLIGAGSDRKESAIATVDGVSSAEEIPHLVSACLGQTGEPEWILPGSTLRGLIRNAVETLSFSRMTQFNRNRFFSLREFQHTEYGYGTYPLLQRENVRCGWIRKAANTQADKSRPAQIQLEILPMQHSDWTEIPASNLIKKTDYKRGGGAFIMEPLKVRLKKLGITPNDGVFDFFAAKPLYAEDGNTPMSPLLTDKVPGKDGQPDTQVNQYLIALPDKESAQNSWQPLAPHAVAQFVEIHSTRVDENLTPKNHLNSYWNTLAAGKPIPVFFVGEPPIDDSEVKQSKFAMGLTRLFRVPHLYDFRTAVEQAYGPSMPRYDAETGKRLSPLDISEALFGFVYEEADLFPSKTAKPTEAPSQKGRLAFGHARLRADTPAKVMEPVVATMGQPQPSFAPYYLAGKWKDYSPPKGHKPKVAGRKTYLPRYNDSVRQSPEQMVRSAARETILNVKQSNTPDASKHKTWSALNFLTPADSGKRLSFSGQIRLQNVVKEEIGAILWALTHGGASDAHRHMIGNAKGLGAGQMRIAKVRLNVAANDGSHVTTDDSLTPYLKAFENYMDGFISDWRRHQVVTTWLAASKPENGSRLAHQGTLRSMGLKKYGELRKQTAPMVDTSGNEFAEPGGHPLIKIAD